MKAVKYAILVSGVITSGMFLLYVILQEINIPNMTMIFLGIIVAVLLSLLSVMDNSWPEQIILIGMAVTPMTIVAALDFDASPIVVIAITASVLMLYRKNTGISLGKVLFIMVLNQITIALGIGFYVVNTAVTLFAVLFIIVCHVVAYIAEKERVKEGLPSLFAKREKLVDSIIEN